MASLLGPRRAIGCAALVLALAVAWAPARAETAPASPPAGGTGWPGRLARIPGPMPTTAPDMLMLADALVRSGHVVEARLVLREVIVQFPDSGWARWGQLGLGFLELARGRMVEAIPYYRAAAVPGFSHDTAIVVLALLDAQAGNTAAATAVLDRLAVDGSVRPPVRDAAAVGAGYARYWAGDYAGAAIAFAVLADNNPGSPLADDALYGLAKAFEQLGDFEAAEQALERAAAMPAQGFDATHVRPALRRLELREILRATRKRYHDVPLGQPEQMLTALLDVNGRVLATKGLRALAKAQARGAEGTTIAAAARDAKAFLARRSTVHVATDAPMGSPPSGPRDSNATVTRPDDGAAPDAAARAAGGPDPTDEPGAGVAGVLLLLLLGALVVVIHRRWGLPLVRRPASRPAGR